MKFILSRVCESVSARMCLSRSKRGVLHSEMDYDKCVGVHLVVKVARKTMLLWEGKEVLFAGREKRNHDFVFFISGPIKQKQRAGMKL